jgi:hypothetical protein
VEKLRAVARSSEDSTRAVDGDKAVTQRQVLSVCKQPR